MVLITLLAKNRLINKKVYMPEYMNYKQLKTNKELRLND
nr:MAG TPA: hypothetical protein [Caudoviricetes sp.]